MIGPITVSVDWIEGFSNDKIGRIDTCYLVFLLGIRVNDLALVRDVWDFCVDEWAFLGKHMDVSAGLEG